MRIVIVSDIHANLRAWRALSEEADELWVLGDLVNYGPQPAAVIEEVRARASLLVRGNHDHALGYNTDPHCSPRFRRMAAEMACYTAGAISEDHKAYLRSLPRTAERIISGTRFYLCHAVPSSPLYAYCPPDPECWEREVSHVDADVILVGHTHVPFTLRIGSKVVVNPGSLGQPKNGRPDACYAVWEGGGIQLKAIPYPVEETIAEILGLPIDPQVRTQLASVLRNGG